MHMAWDEDQLLMLVGFGIVMVVGLNMVLAFGGFGHVSLTGATVSQQGLACGSTSEGIVCEKTLYPNTPVTGVCPLDFVPVCTNACKLDVAIYSRARDCSNPCTEICVPKNLVEKLQ
mgnify:CR=1 FL=1